MASAEPDPLSIEELRANLTALTKPDHLRLHKAARYFAHGSGLDAGELIDEAVCAALDGKRSCRRDLPILVFLIGAIRSRAGWARKQLKKEPVFESMSATGTEDKWVQIRDPARDPEEMLSAKEGHEARLRKLEELFDGDEDAQLVLIGDFDGMSADEIREQTGFSETQYATVRRRIRRKIEKAIGLEGWQQ